MKQMSDNQGGDMIRDLQAAIKVLRRHNDALMSGMEYIKARSKASVVKSAVDRLISLEDIFKTADLTLESIKKESKTG